MLLGQRQCWCHGRVFCRLLRHDVEVIWLTEHDWTKIVYSVVSQAGPGDKATNAVEARRRSAEGLDSDTSTGMSRIRWASQGARGLQTKGDRASTRVLSLGRNCQAHSG